MKTSIKNLLLMPALIAGLCFILAIRVTAQTFTTLHSFTGGSDGAYPSAELILSGNTLYGTTSGLSSGLGTVFGVHTDGTGFTTLHSFTGSDGYWTEAGVILSSNILYGTASRGGSSDKGTVFKVNTDGTGFINLHSFTCGTDGTDGGLPTAGLILSGNTLYGTAAGNLGDPVPVCGGGGTVFAVNTDGTGFTTLHAFIGGSDGAHPQPRLILSGDILYGTASRAGASSRGMVFRVNSDGTGFTNLYSFTAGSGFYPFAVNTDGAYPSAGLILSGNTLYGTAHAGGTSGSGTVFAVNTDGTGFTNLHNFAVIFPPLPAPNSDGAYPSAELILSGNTLYGTTTYGGTSGSGTVFAVNTDGTSFTTLYNFTGSSDGSIPQAGLILLGNTPYGTTIYGGSSGNGTVFSLSLGSVGAPQLKTFLSGASIILTWPTNIAGFTLQSAPAITSTFTSIPGATGPFTNPITGAQQFFRLISN